MQMTDSDFTLNDWWRRLGGGGAGHYAQLGEDTQNWDPLGPHPPGTENMADFVITSNATIIFNMYMNRNLAVANITLAQT